jgi:Kef-type K+ transport system membrane component KefB
MRFPQSRARLRSVVAMIALPIIALTIYLLWLWPRPSGTSLAAQTGPYLLSLLTGIPFALRAARGTGRVFVIITYLLVGFLVLWVYALAVLCGVRGVCL